jgi:aerobic carbon-monoxide dehydrogenase large subunit
MRQLARAAYHQSHHFPVVVETGLSAVATYDPYGTFSNACHIAIVAVDIATGQVTIERFVVVEDAGRLINPMIVEGQIHGGVAQGIANALYEKVIHDDRGNVLTGSLADYPVPTTAEIPTIEIHHLETLTEASVTGAKGVGEGGTIGAPAGGTQRGFRRARAVWHWYLRNADHAAADLAAAARGGVQRPMNQTGHHSHGVR